MTRAVGREAAGGGELRVQGRAAVAAVSGLPITCHGVDNAAAQVDHPHA